MNISPGKDDAGTDTALCPAETSFPAWAWWRIEQMREGWLLRRDEYPAKINPSACNGQTLPKRCAALPAENSIDRWDHLI